MGGGDRRRVRNLCCLCRLSFCNASFVPWKSQVTFWNWKSSDQWCLHPVQFYQVLDQNITQGKRWKNHFRLVCISLKVSSALNTLCHLILSLNTASNDRCWQFNNQCVHMASVLNDSYSLAKCSVSLLEPCWQKYVSQTQQTAIEGQFFLSKYASCEARIIFMLLSNFTCLSIFITLFPGSAYYSVTCCINIPCADTHRSLYAVHWRGHSGRSALTKPVEALH